MTLTTRVLIGLVAGLAAGAAIAAYAPGSAPQIIAVAEPAGGLWLDALRMTIIPLVFALLVTGVSQAADTARAGGDAARTLGLFAVLLVASAAFSAIATPALLAIWPAPAEAAQALRAAAHAAAGEIPPTPTIEAMLKSFIPTNPVQVAAEGAMAPLVVFALVFGLAATRIAAEHRASLLGFFAAVKDTMMVLVHWVLWAAPFGVFALALVTGARTGLGAVGVLGHYVIVVSIMCLSMAAIAVVLAVAFGRVPFMAFVRAMIPVEAVAISTQSSLASLPAMLDTAERLGVPDKVRGMVLPMAVALFRMTSPAGNMAVVIYVAHVYGVALSPMVLAVGVLVAATVSLAAVGIASAVTFFTTLGPISMAMGVPMELLPLLLAVETLPDISRTIGNVTADVAVTTMAAEWSLEEDAEEELPVTEGV
ncbi:MAG: cation:dicarboxylase symporter family transporter [Pseudomonadota bacterium]